MNGELTDDLSEEIPTIEEVEIAELTEGEIRRGKRHQSDDATDARAQLSRDAEAAWGVGDGAGQTWESPSPNESGWIPTTNTWALHQSDEVAAWLQRKRANDARDLALMPERMA